MKVVVSNIVLDRLILTVRVETKREENIFSVQQKKKKNEMVSNDMILGELSLQAGFGLLFINI